MKSQFNHTDHSLHLYETGHKNNHAIIFLHGVGSSGLMWEAHMKSLQSYYCIAPDLPGHGNSRGVEWSTLSQTADYIRGLILSLPHNRASLVGLSLGGSVTIELLGKYSSIIDHAIVDGSGVIPIKGVKAIKLGVSLVSPFIHSGVVIKAVSAGIGIQKADMKNFSRDMKMVSPASFRRAFCQANEMTLPPAMDKVTTPTLFVAGDKEAKETIESNRKLAALLPNATCRIAPELGHGWLAQKPDLHIEMVRAWIEEGNIMPELKKC